MGSKTGSRRRMETAGVPVVPGHDAARRRARARSRSSARRAGYPILLKASAGGGGKGMRRVDARGGGRRRPSTRVSAEAAASFGDGAVYAEKLIERPRHIEVQVVGRPARERSSRSASASAASSGATRRSSRSARRRPSTTALRARLCAAAVARGASRRLHLLRHRRVPARAGRLLLLPRDEHAPPGRAPRDRGGLGRGPRGAR